MTAPDARLGEALADRYRIEREIGAGGMATVYLAHDLRHDRKVAIKVLHPELAAVIGAERFLTEIRTTANLQHPHILPLYDSGAVAHGDRPAIDHRLLFYVMPFVAGESLRQRLTRERQLPVADAVRITQEVASALDYAHRQGVIHRDIKPENILLHDGSALVADFGIALAVTAAGGGRLTQTGLSLGTPAYMSPEQAMGERDIGPRTDVYSLGAVAYELLTGEPPFTGPTSQAIVARTLTESPRPPRAERKSIPPHVEAAVLTALEKLPADRFGSAKEFGEALQDGTVTRRMKGARPEAPASSRRVTPLLAVVSGVAALFAATALSLWATRPRPTAPPTPVEFRPVEMGTLDYFSVSTDGKFIVGTAPDSNGVYRVLLRRLGEAQATIVPGTENVVRAWLTPDNQSLVLRTTRALRLVPVTGGGGRDLVAVDGYTTVEWGRGDSLIAVVNNRLLVVPLDGGTIRTIATIDSAANESYYIPRLLPGGRNLLVGQRHSPDSVSLFQMDIATGKAELVHPNMQEVRPYGTDRLLWLDGDGRLHYGTYDQGTRRFGARDVVLAEGIDDLFANGDVVVLRPGLPQRDMWLLSADAREPTRRAIADTSIANPRFSPDGREVALLLTPAAAAQRSTNVQSSNATHLWILDRITGLRRHIMEHASEMAWFPDGRHLLVLRSRPRPQLTEVWRVAADGATPPERLPAGIPGFNPSVAADGSGFAYVDTRGGRLLFQPFASPGQPAPAARVLFDEPGNEFWPLFSPDGKWLLYGVEDASGAFLVARAWPALDRRVVVTPVGFCPAFWADGGRRIYTCLPDGTLTWIGFDPVAGRTTGAPQAVGITAPKNPEFSVNPSGTDLAWVPVSPRYGTEVRVLANWRADAERRLAGK